MKVRNDGQTLLGGLRLGGSGDDQVRGLARSPDGVVHVDGQTASTDFPTTPGAATMRSWPA